MVVNPGSPRSRRKPQLTIKGTLTAGVRRRTVSAYTVHIHGDRVGSSSRFGARAHRDLGRSLVAVRKIKRSRIQRIARVDLATRLRRRRCARQKYPARPRLIGHIHTGCVSGRRASLHRHRTRLTQARRRHRPRLIDPHIIHRHHRRRRRRLVCRTRPRSLASHRQIHQQEKWMIEHPALSRRNVTRRNHVKNFSWVVHIKLNHVRRPDRPISVPAGHVATGQRILLRQPFVAGISRPMQRGADLPGSQPS